MLAVPSDNMRSVAFLTVDEPGEDGIIRRIPKATAFFVGVQVENTPHRVDYFVTARHCIDQAGANRKLFIRFNTKTTGFVEVETNTDDWFQSDTDDVAVILGKPGGLAALGLSPREIDGSSVGISAFVGADYWWRGEAPEIGWVQIQPSVGNEVYFVGLFSEHFGQERNLPVARFGHISRMPSDIDLKSGDVWFTVTAYLMEFHSWGGHSGSPVFFMYPITIQAGSSVDMGYISGLMGLVSAHYDIEKKAAKTGDIVGEVQVGLNSGIAVVTPAEAIRQILMREDVTDQRRVLIADATRRTPPPTLDMAGSTRG